MSPENDGLTPEERTAFAGLEREPDVPPGLEDRVTATLVQRGLVRRPRPGTPAWARRALAIAAGLAILAAGTWIGRTTAVPAELPRATYALLLYDGPEFDPYTEANYPGRFDDFSQWIAELRAADRFVGGEALDDSAMLLRPDDGGAPLSEPRMPESEDGTISGILFIDADSFDEAARIAASVPHLRYGGRVALRRVDPT